jgi:protein phosphatase
MPHRPDSDTVELPRPVADADIQQPHPFSSLVQVEVGGLSHAGKVRPNNEDHFLAARFSRSMLTLKTNLAAGQIPNQFDEAGYCFAVADGMGGMAAGEVASSLAITIGINLVLNAAKWNLLMTPDEAREHMERTRRRFRQIDYVLTRRAKADPDLWGMGTTLTVATSIGDHLFLYHAGDSRAYRFRQGQLHQLTRDQTKAQELADAGLIPPEQVATHRLRHVLTNALGRSAGDIEIEIQDMQLTDGDRVLLCTDGLTDMVDDATIADVLGRIDASEPACQALVDLALERGGKDNVTVVLARYTIPPATPAPPAEPAPPA